jgi:hypothetical protein
MSIAPNIGFLATLVLLVDRDWVNNKVPAASASVYFVELWPSAGS